MSIRLLFVLLQRGSRAFRYDDTTYYDGSSWGIGTILTLAVFLGVLYLIGRAFSNWVERDDARKKKKEEEEREKEYQHWKNVEVPRREQALKTAFEKLGTTKEERKKRIETEMSKYTKAFDNATGSDKDKACCLVRHIYITWLDREGLDSLEAITAFNKWADIHFVDGQRYWKEHWKRLCERPLGPFQKAREEFDNSWHPLSLKWAW